MDLQTNENTHSYKEEDQVPKLKNQSISDQSEIHNSNVLRLTIFSC